MPLKIEHGPPVMAHSHGVIGVITVLSCIIMEKMNNLINATKRQKPPNCYYFIYFDLILKTKSIYYHIKKGTSSSFGRLREKVWKRRSISFETKLQVYRAVVLPSLLYGSESWTVYSRHLQKLQSFHMRCLRHILHVKWQDHTPDTEVLQNSNLCMLFRSL